MASYLVKWPTPDSHLDLHADWTYVDERVQPSYAAWVPLVDTGRDHDNGPLLVVPGSHRVVRSWRGTATPAWYEAGRAGFLAAAIPVEAPAGSVVLFDNRLLHHSPPNRSAVPRPVLAGAFAPTGATLLHVVGDGGPFARVIEVEAEFFAANNPSGLRAARPVVPDDAPTVPLVDAPPDPIALAADHGLVDAAAFHGGPSSPGDRRWAAPTAPLDLGPVLDQLDPMVDVSSLTWAPEAVERPAGANGQVVLVAGAHRTPVGRDLLPEPVGAPTWWSLRLVRIPAGSQVELAPTGTGRGHQIGGVGLGPDDPALLVRGTSGWATIAARLPAAIPDEAVQLANRSGRAIAVLVGEVAPDGRLPQPLQARLSWWRTGRHRWRAAVELAEAVS
jgi:hypothetical protein